MGSHQNDKNMEYDIDNLSVGTRVSHEKYGEGIISQNNALTYKIIFVRGGELEFSKAAVALEVIDQQGNRKFPFRAVDMAEIGDGGAACRNGILQDPAGMFDDLAALVPGQAASRHAGIDFCCKQRFRRVNIPDARYDCVVHDEIFDRTLDIPRTSEQIFRGEIIG